MMTPKTLTRELVARLGGPHSDEHTAAAADLAAEAVRFLNYATRVDEGLTFPSTAYQVAGNLHMAVYRMPQCFTQVAVRLGAMEAAGLLGIDDGTSAAEVVAAVSFRLAAAARKASALADELGEIQQLLSPVNGRGPNRRTGGAS